MDNDTHRLPRVVMHLLDVPNNSLPEVFRAIGPVGVLLNGIPGDKVVRERNFGTIGFYILVIMMALAGSMIRDLLLTTHIGTPVAIMGPYYLGFVIVGALIVMVLRTDSRAWLAFLVIANGMVLGCWSATGAIKTLDTGFMTMSIILTGIVTATSSGMAHDISAGLMPCVFGGNNLYATPAFACSLITVIFWRMGQPVLGMGTSIIVGLMFIGMAHWYRWKFPQIREWTIILTYSQLKAPCGGKR